MTDTPNGNRRAIAADRRRAALDLRKSGHTFDEIACTMKANPEVDTPKTYTKAEAWRDVNKILTEIREQTAEDGKAVLAVELQRLDGITRGAYVAAVNGDAVAANTVLKAMDRRAKLLGLDQPSRHEILLTPDVIAAEIARLEAIVEPDDSPD